MTKPVSSINGPSRLAGRRHQASAPLTAYGMTIQPSRKRRSADGSSRALARLRMSTPMSTCRVAAHPNGAAGGRTGEKTAPQTAGLLAGGRCAGLTPLRTGQSRPIDAKKVVMSVIRRHRVLVFFLLAIALSWGAIPWQSFFAPGVLVAALIVVGATEGLTGLKAMGKRLIRWRVSWIWYAIALAVPLAVKFVSIGLNTALGAPVPDLGALNLWYSVPMAIAINIVNPMNAQLPEEASFRGWAQPTLQLTRTPLAATVLMAVGVTIWHLPLFVMGQFGSSPIEALATVSVTFWYAWLFNHASGSALLTLIAHATEGVIETSTLWQASADTTRMTWLYSLVWCAVAIGLLVFNRRFWTIPPAQIDDRDNSAARRARGSDMAAGSPS